MMATAAALERNPLDVLGSATDRRRSSNADPRGDRRIPGPRHSENCGVGATQEFVLRRAPRSPFPRQWPRSLDEFAHAPLTSPADIVDRGQDFLCVPQSEISRVVTLESSGTSGARKRVFFTADDQELALDFFAHGVAAMAAKGDRMLIALPGEREGSVGYQLARGIARAGVVPIPYGLILDPTAALALHGP